MENIQLILGLLLAGVLFVVAGVWAWRQRRPLRAVREDAGLSPEDRRYLWQQALRRLLSSFLLAVLAGMLVGWFFLEPTLGGLQEVFAGAGPQDLPESTKDEIRLFTFYWIGALLLLMVILALAVLDLRATARYGLRNQRQLEQDRRAMLEEEAARLRRRRSEMN